MSQCRNETYNLYQLTPVTELDEYRGRMYVRTARPRNFILKGETLAGTMQIVEISLFVSRLVSFPATKTWYWIESVWEPSSGRS